MAPKNAKRKHSKVELVFNPQERHEFLTGFSKRKQARRKAAQADIEKKFKEEVARIKKEKRDRMKQRLEEVASVRRSNGVELLKLAENELDKEKVLDLPQHVVTITSTEELDLTKSNDMEYLGSNAVEVVNAEDTEQNDDVESENKNEEAKQTSITQSKTARNKSAAHVASLARKVQVLNSKKKHKKVLSAGKMSKSQKKFLKKKSKHKSKPSR